MARMTPEELYATNENARIMAMCNARNGEALRVRACRVMARIVGKSGRGVSVSAAERQDVERFLAEICNETSRKKVLDAFSCNPGMVHTS